MKTKDLRNLTPNEKIIVNPMATSTPVFTAPSTNFDTERHLDLSLFLAPGLPSAIAKLTELENTGRLVAKIHHAKGLEVTRYALQAKFYLNDAIYKKSAADVQALCQTYKELCRRYRPLRLAAVVAMSALEMLEEIPTSENTPQQLQICISDDVFQRMIARIEACKKTACQAVLYSNVMLADTAKTMAEEVVDLWRCASKCSPQSHQFLSANSDESESVTKLGESVRQSDVKTVVDPVPDGKQNHYEPTESRCSVNSYKRLSDFKTGKPKSKDLMSSSSGSSILVEEERRGVRSGHDVRPFEMWILMAVMCGAFFTIGILLGAWIAKSRTCEIER